MYQEKMRQFAYTILYFIIYPKLAAAARVTIYRRYFYS